MAIPATDGRSAAVDRQYDDWSRVSVPEAARHSLHRTVFEWIGFAFFPVAITTSAALARTLPFRSFVIAAVLGSWLLAAASAASGYVAQRTGFTFGLLAHRVFGTRGYILPCALVPICLVGWNSFNLALMATATANLLGMPQLYSVLCFCYMLLFAAGAVVGFRWISTLSLVAVPGIVAILLYGAARVLATPDRIGTLTTQGGRLIDSTAITAIVGLFALGTSVSSPDIQRFCRTGRDAILTAVITFGVAFPVLLIASGLAGMAAQGDSINAIFAAMGLQVVGLLVLLLLTWTTADNDYYSASLGFAALTRFPRSTLVGFAAVPAAIIAALNLQDYLVTWLVLMSTIATPLAGVLFAALVSGELAETSSLPKLRLDSYLAWIFGAIAVYASTRTNTPIPPLNGMLVAFVFRVASSRLTAWRTK